MTRRSCILALPLALGAVPLDAQEASPPATAVPEPPPLDPAIRTMIEAAIHSGDVQAANTVLRFARQASPRGGAEIDRHRSGVEDGTRRQ